MPQDRRGEALLEAAGQRRPEWSGLAGATIEPADTSLLEALRETGRRIVSPMSAPEDEFSTAPLHDWAEGQGVPGAVLAGLIPSTKQELPGTVANAAMAGTGAAGKPYVNAAGQVVEQVHQWGSPTSKWVMRGSSRPLNYILSGKWLGTPQALGGNQRAAYATGRALEVPVSELAAPPGWEAIKWMLGQAVRR